MNLFTLLVLPSVSHFIITSKFELELTHIFCKWLIERTRETYSNEWAPPPTQVILINYLLQLFMPPHTMQLKTNKTIFQMTATFAMIVGPWYPVTNHHSILKSVRGSEKEIGMQNYLTSKRMNYYKNVVKLTNKRKFCRRITMHVHPSKLKQDVQMLEHVMQT